MIDHSIIIGAGNVDEDFLKVNVQQSMDTDSDPGKLSITLANPHQKYTNKWPPQKTPIVITLYNWVYRSEEERQRAGGRAEAEYLVATGSLTDLKATSDEVVVIGECGMGHLADALPTEYDVVNVTPKEVLEEVLSWHKDKKIILDWDPNLKNEFKERKTFDSYQTYQDVIEDIRDTVGAVAYFSTEDILVFRDPFNPIDTYDLDPYVTNPEQTASIMGFRNVVVIIGDQSLADEGDEEGIESPGSDPVIGIAKDLDSIGEVGFLIAPAIRCYDIKTQEQADQKAADLLRFYKMYRNAQTVVEVEGILPPVQSIVSYTPFIPISDTEIAKMNTSLAARLTELQAIEDGLAIEQDRLVKKLIISSKVRGIVVSRDVEYSIDGMHAKLTISPGLLDGEPITDDDISGSVWNPEDEE